MFLLETLNIKGLLFFRGILDTVLDLPVSCWYPLILHGIDHRSAYSVWSGACMEKVVSFIIRYDLHTHHCNCAVSGNCRILFNNHHHLGVSKKYVKYSAIYVYVATICVAILFNNDHHTGCLRNMLITV